MAPIGISGSNLIVPPRPAPISLSGVGFPNLPSARIIPIPAFALSSGENDVYTVPSGKRAVIAGTITNLSGGALNVTYQFKNGGTYYKIVIISIANNSQLQIIPFNTFPILESGESFSLLTAGIGLNFAGYAIIFDNTEQLSSPKILSLSNGDNTLFTCPAGRVAYILNVISSNALIRVFNDSGAARTYTMNVVPSFGSPSSVNQINIPTSTADKTQLNTVNEGVGMNTGDSINVNATSGTATQTSWIPNLVTRPV